MGLVTLAPTLMQIDCCQLKEERKGGGVVSGVPKDTQMCLTSLISSCKYKCQFNSSIFNSK